MSQQGELFGGPRAGAAPADAFATARRMSFDIELADVFELGPDEDLDSRGPFNIAVVAVATDTGAIRHWYQRDPAGNPTGHIDRAIAHEVLEFLRAAQLRGAQVCAWNGLSFDLRWLGHVAEDLDLATAIALDLIDPMFQFFCQRGFAISLGAAADGMGLAEKKLMSGADAPREWANGAHQLVLDYVASDCRITDDVIGRIQTAGAVRWRTKRGTRSAEPMPTLRTVRELIPLPTPDQTWMDAPLPKEKFFRWLSRQA